MQYFETVGGKHTTHIVKRNDNKILNLKRFDLFFTYI